MLVTTINADSHEYDSLCYHVYWLFDNDARHCKVGSLKEALYIAHALHLTLDGCRNIKVSEHTELHGSTRNVTVFELPDGRIWGTNGETVMNWGEDGSVHIS